ncbi:MAG: pyridoxal-phosphate dependent enzyme [Pseudomonadota bacterium]
MNTDVLPPSPNIDAIRLSAASLAPHVDRTPVIEWTGDRAHKVSGLDATLVFKLELMQRTGSFKARGAVASVMALSAPERARGVTAISAGNHAIAVAYAARVLGTSAKVVMLQSANPARVAAVRALGAELLMASDGMTGFQMVDDIAREEERTFIHPFEGETLVTATGTIGLELDAQSEPLDACIVALGGGGLGAGIAASLKQLQPDCQMIGVEPEGADVVHQSFARGAPVSGVTNNTIADSLAPPMTEPYTLGVCRRYFDALVKVDDVAMCRGMVDLYTELKLVTEPAGAAAYAAATGPLQQALAGKRVGIIVCGGNIDVESFAAHLRTGGHAPT